VPVVFFGIIDGIGAKRSGGTLPHKGSAPRLTIEWVKHWQRAARANHLGALVSLRFSALASRLRPPVCTLVFRKTGSMSILESATVNPIIRRSASAFFKATLAKNGSSKGRLFDVAMA